MSGFETTVVKTNKAVKEKASKTGVNDSHLVSSIEEQQVNELHETDDWGKVQYCDILFYFVHVSPLIQSSISYSSFTSLSNR